MTRDDGWRFMSLGRHLERLLYVVDHGRRSRDVGDGRGSGAARVAARSVGQHHHLSRALHGPRRNGWRWRICCCSIGATRARRRSSCRSWPSTCRLLPGGDPERLCGRRAGAAPPRQRELFRADRPASSRGAERLALELSDTAHASGTSATSTNPHTRRCCDDHPSLPHRAHNPLRLLHAGGDVAARRLPAAARAAVSARRSLHDRHRSGPGLADDRVDYFGNAVDQFQILRPHSSLVVRSSGSSRCASATTARRRREPALGRRAPMLIRQNSACPPDVAQFVSASPYVADLVRDRSHSRGASFPSGRPMLGGALDLMHASTPSSPSTPRRRP